MMGVNLRAGDPAVPLRVILQAALPSTKHQHRRRARLVARVEPRLYHPARKLGADENELRHALGDWRLLPARQRPEFRDVGGGVTAG